MGWCFIMLKRSRATVALLLLIAAGLAGCDDSGFLGCAGTVREAIGVCQVGGQHDSSG